MPICLDRYPLEENVRENEAEDARCLAIVEDLIQQAVSYLSINPFFSIQTLTSISFFLYPNFILLTI